ncbi:MAG: ATP-binding protein [Magnetococcales bacterium]|nr:ATP-binding protein [Magnetococcales bacterium]
MSELKVIRIFISSPGDVNPEREVARRVIERLNREFSYHFRIEAVLWEREPLIATEHFQTMITPPSETDIVVVVVWSRLGSFLPHGEFQGKVTGKVPVTGTEWEFEDAVHAYRQHGKPDLLLYRKQARISADLDDRQELEKRLDQKDLLEKFLTHWFHDDTTGGFKAASHQFTDAGQLEEMLEMQLRSLLKQRVNLPEGEALQVDIHWHEGSPFRGLESFDLKHAPIFCGRTKERLELRDALASQAARGCAFLLVFGASGSGKSSLVKAGLLSDLKIPGMMEKVGLVRHAIVRPTDDEDLSVVLAKGFLSADALPELTSLQCDQATLTSLLRDAPQQAMFPVRQGLAKAGEQAKLINDAQPRLLLIVDQLEELFTQPKVGQAEREGFVLALKALAESGQVWVIATMRSDFFDRLATLPDLANLSEKEGRYLLLPPSPSAIGQIIRQPAREAGLRYEKDPKTGTGLDELLQEAASRDGALLPLLSFSLEALWERRTSQGVLTHATYEAIGRLEGALGQKAEEIFHQLEDEQQLAFPGVLRRLVTVGEGGKPAARTVPLEQFGTETHARQVVDLFSSSQERLLVTDGNGASSHVRFVHEAILNN